MTGVGSRSVLHRDTAPERVVLRPQHAAITTGNHDRKRKGWDLNATGQSAAAEPGGTAVLYR